MKRKIVVLALILAASGCAATRAKVGGAIGTVGTLVTDVGGTLTSIASIVLGVAEDAKTSTDTIGITDAAEPAK